ncbi:MAG: translation initiation factor IF-3 [Candidatus Marinimicrobia bacterium]|nr:translation initiation factor IF-3 [Candidatus Neomarinimicrobiota bacterium]MDP5957244.1 translation initiation factor IF-3 [Candidatus Neomarinimicrobiota bacterium]MDP6499332.1 translation initiation factor IF-3 [Candidatus Neomarinimicrobiota bacterium]MDP6726328.1 translation initiation factor IF-3 [Candidatus Neomarinimicrobiota bacterium]MDP7094922.1 translation initiation factor IF-3 [Candidatus Neomarinimicrobiota bacterium]
MGKRNKTRINDKITEDEVRLISEVGEQLGVVKIDDALQKAQDAGLDLVEVAPNSKPPVCKILNFGKIKYEAKKKLQNSKKKQHVIKIKEVRVRPAIGENDLNTKMNMGRKFLKDGCKLKVTIMFRGRELSRAQEMGDAILERITAMLEDISEPDQQSELEGRRISVMFTAK